MSEEAGAEIRRSKAALRARPAPRRRSVSTRPWPWRLGRALVIFGLLLFTGGPLVYTVLLSVRDLPAVVSRPLDLLPTLDELNLRTYWIAFSSPEQGGFGLGRFMLNSALVATTTVVVTLLASIFGAYAVARLGFTGRRALAGLFFTVYLFPVVVVAVPLFVLFARLQLRGSLAALVVIYLAHTVPVAVYMLRHHFQAVPESVEEAAMIDGCGRLGVVLRVVFPLTAPAIAATALYVFVIAWNEYLFALLFLVDRRDRWTVSLGLAQLTAEVAPVTILMAGSVILSVPVVVLFALAERYLVSGLTAGAEKG